ncbi:MAG TPA: TAXI family TRAP transporter solute-binding subunit [Burkholderiales bacterium]|nr:TAXI family TRAP transporter solute-binding subunit [Burkholderiales bacterium]
MRIFLILISLIVAGCSRGPDEAALKSEVQQKIDKSFKPGLLALAGIKRQGSSPLPAGESGAPRVVVYYNATLRLKEGYDFKDWEGLSPATLANVLGGRERGVIGVRVKENQPGDLLRVYGSGIYERSGDAWTAVAGAQRDVSQAPADPGSAAPATDSQRYLERLASQVNIGPPGIDSRSDKIISEELEHALRVINRRRARAQELATFASGPAGGEYTRVVEAIIGTVAKQGRKVRVLAVETEGSIENALLLGRGQAEYGLVQSDVASLAVQGAGPFAADGPLTKLAALGSLYPEPVHIVVPAKSAIRRVEDLRGKRVDLGTPKSGTRINALAILQAHRIAIKDLAEARGDGPQAAMQQMRVGQLDAFFTTVGAPSRELQRLAAAVPIRLLPISSSPIDKILAEQAGLVRLTLAANTYPGQAEPVATVAATALLVGTIDTPQDEVKALLELAFEGTDYLAFGSAQGVKISKASGLRGIAIPLHPAAAEYFGKPVGAKPAAKPKPAAKK